MKKLLFILAISFSFAAKSQADPAFTTKFKVYSDAVKAYHSASQADKPAKMQLVTNALVTEFDRIPPNELDNKMQAMMNDPTEVAKLFNPVGFTLCIAQQALYYQQCQSSYPYGPHSACVTMAVGGIGLCVVNYL